MAKKAQRGLFGPKNVRAGGCLFVSGYLGKEASRLFEAARLRLASLAAADASTLSGADVVEYLVRGEENSLKRIRWQREQ